MSNPKPLPGPYTAGKREESFEGPYRSGKYNLLNQKMVFYVIVPTACRNLRLVKFGKSYSPVARFNEYSRLYNGEYDIKRLYTFQKLSSEYIEQGRQSFVDKFEVELKRRLVGLGLAKGEFHDIKHLETILNEIEKLRSEKNSKPTVATLRRQSKRTPKPTTRPTFR